MKLFESYINKLDLSDADKELVLRFFVAFSLFECALKRAGFVYTRNGRVFTNWKEFEESLEERFNPHRTEELERAVGYLKEKPPKKQKVEDKKLDWEKIPRPDATPSIKWLLDMVNIIRNNLFHGGKYPIDPIEEPARNKKLLESGLIILKECLKLNDEVERELNNII